MAALLCCVLFAVGPAAAAMADSADKVTGSKKASPTSLTANSRDTKVTLSMPSGEAKHVYDIVFVMDSSTSTVNANIDFSPTVADLLEALVAKDATVKVGVVKCRGLAYDTTDLASGGAHKGLVEYSDSTKADILAGVNYPEASLKRLSSGTNMHGGLVMAQKLLSADASVPDDNKYVIMLTDGKSYIWNDDHDVPTSIYAQYYTWQRGKGIINTSSGSGKPYIGQNMAYIIGGYPISNGIKASSGYAYEFTTLKDDQGNGIPFWFDEDYAKLYASDNPELTGSTKYDQKCWYVYGQGAAADGTVLAHETTNGEDIFTNNYAIFRTWYEYVPNSVWEDRGITYLEGNPFEVVQSGDGYTITSQSNPDFYYNHATSLMKGLYKLGHLWTDMDAKYHTAAVTYSAKSTGSGINTAKSFCDWIRSNSDAGARMEDAATVKALFDDIKEEIIYMVDAGSVVTDIIASEFTLKQNGNDTFSVTRGGTSLTVQAAGSGWDFYEGSEKVCSITYDEGTRTITWKFFQPIENARPVTLSYWLTLNDGVAPGKYDTNESAVLDYITTDGGEGTFVFPKPKVTYTGPKNLPKTGDSAPLVLFTAMAVIGISAFLLLRRRRKA